jgi:hypothetical protein
MITLSPRSYLALTLFATATLVCVNLAAIAIRHGAAEDAAARAWARLFIMDEEKNLATLLNFSLIMVNAALLALIAFGAVSTRRPWRWHWCALAVLFLAMGFDEASSLHEKLNVLARPFAPDTPALTFAWVLPGALFVLTIGLAFLRFVLALPRASARLFAIAGGIYVGGALGVEVLGAALSRLTGRSSPAYLSVATLEEALEMAGMALFGYALLRLLAGADGRVSLPSPAL